MIYNVDFYSCNSCSLLVAGSIGNSNELTIGKWYLDPVTNNKILVKEEVTCSVGSDRNILDSSSKDFCVEIVCQTTTTTTTL
jgi:hypothetical protein